MPKVLKRPTPERLANAALYYLSRYAASEGALRRVLGNKIRRAAMADPVFAADKAAQAALAAAIEKIVETHKRTGAINDAAFAETKVSSLRRAGRSARRIAQSLAHKGVAAPLIEAALTANEEEGGGDAEERAARAFARRRGLGPYRKGGASKDRAVQAKEIASLARAGFAFDVAKKVVDAQDDEFFEEK